MTKSKRFQTQLSRITQSTNLMLSNPCCIGFSQTPISTPFGEKIMIQKPSHQCPRMFQVNKKPTYSTQHAAATPFPSFHQGALHCFPQILSLLTLVLNQKCQISIVHVRNMPPMNSGPLDSWEDHLFKEKPKLSHRNLQRKPIQGSKRNDFFKIELISFKSE